MSLPKLLVPRDIRDAALEEARALATRALDGVFGLIRAETLRRQSYAYAHEQALFHEEMARRLTETPIRIVGKYTKIARHSRLAMRWAARAKARDPRLAQVCGLYSSTMCEAA